MPGVVVRARPRAHGTPALQLEKDAGVVTSGPWLRLVTQVLSGDISVPELKGSEQFTVLTPKAVRAPPDASWLSAEVSVWGGRPAGAEPVGSTALARAVRSL